jgi:serine phosphatase RsbU (regulator of sigma subunit)
MGRISRSDHVPGNQDGMLADLLDRLDQAPAAAMMDVSFEALRDAMGLRHLWLYVADYSEEYLKPVPTLQAPPPPDRDISIRGSVPGRVYMTREILEAENEGGPALWVPIFRRSDRLGVLSFGVKEHDPRVTALAPAVALAIGAAVVGAQRHSDLFELARGARQLSIAASLQWELLPLPIYEDPHVELAGRVEPAYDIGGDAFDFAVNADRVEIAIFDAMGHGLRATLMTTLAVGAYRFARRRSESLRDMARDIDEAVHGYSAEEAFVTGHLCRLHRDGTITWLNAGHPVPLLLRDHSAAPLGDATPMLPFGLEGAPQELETVQLQPGDIVLFFSDGVIEARPEGGEPFGTERFLDMAGRHGHPHADPLLLVRQILESVKEHSRNVLRDDATLVAVRWLGREEPEP